METSLDASKDDESVEVIEVEPVNQKKVGEQIYSMNADVTVPANRDWFQVTVLDKQIRNATVAVVSGCFLKGGKPFHRNKAFHTYAVTPQGSAGVLDIYVGVNSWNGQKVRLNIMISY
jgi:hypothetical protein